MSTYKFLLNPGSDNLEISEPKGFDGLQISIKRDDKLHGMQFTASLSSLDFTKEAYTFLKDKKETEGLKATVIFQALEKCNEEDDFTEIVRGKLNFGQYKETCGQICAVSLPIDDDSCQVALMNRYDQKVDVDATMAFNQTTALPAYLDMGFNTVIHPRELKATIEGSGSVDFDDTMGFETSGVALHLTSIFRPTYTKEIYNSIKTGNLQPGGNFQNSQDAFYVISPQMLFEDTAACFTRVFDYTFRLKGTANVTSVLGTNHIDSAKVKVVLWDANGSIFTNSTLVQQIDLGVSTNPPHTFSFDQTLTGSTPVGEGVGMYAFLEIVTNETLVGVVRLNVTFDPEVYVLISATKSCPPTSVQSYMVHETLSRVTEAITNYCIRVKSSFYGRIDSMPFDFVEDGCGSLRMLTSGLKMRNAPAGKFFASLKDLIEGLQAIDNIGMGVEVDETQPDYFVLRVEALDFFYTEDLIVTHNLISEATTEMEEVKFYAKINIGYKKWEVQDINGLDEFNSNREYRTSLDSVNNTLDQTSALVAGSYPIEVTRDQSFAESGGADTGYDNDIFIVCMKRNGIYGYAYGGLVVEQGNIDTPANIFAPDTVYNYRISPLRNLMRWYRSILPSYVGADKLFFSAGTGNLLAKGKMTAIDCREEADVITENQDIFTSNFANAADYLPLWKNETITYDYPMSFNDFLSVKAKPYGYVRFQCGIGEYDKGYIKEIKYTPAKGIATFTLRKKWTV